MPSSESHSEEKLPAQLTSDQGKVNGGEGQENMTSDRGLGKRPTWVFVKQLNPPRWHKSTRTLAKSQDKVHCQTDAVWGEFFSPRTTDRSASQGYSILFGQTWSPVCMDHVGID